MQDVYFYSHLLIKTNKCTNQNQNVFFQKKKQSEFTNLNTQLTLIKPDYWDWTTRNDTVLSRHFMLNNIYPICYQKETFKWFLQHQANP